MKDYYCCSDEFNIKPNYILKRIRVVIPSKLQSLVLQELHSFHSGYIKMKSVARVHCWWCGFDMQIENLVAWCEECKQQLPCPLFKPHADFVDLLG